MKVVIAGSRRFTRPELVQAAIEKAGFEITEVVCGGARGIYILGQRWAKENGIPVKHFLAQWNEYGKAAGPARNWQMAQYADALIAIWDGDSSDTSDMITKAIERGISIYVYYPDGRGDRELLGWDSS